MTKKINISTAINIIKSNKFFSAKFIKKDGSVRFIYGRAGVKKHLKPNAKPQAYKPSELGYITVWDLAAKEYRLINSQTITIINGYEVK